MNDEQIKALQNKNTELLFILGVSSSAVLSMRNKWPKEKEEGFLWIIQAIENVVYQDKPMPPWPENL